MSQSEDELGAKRESWVRKWRRQFDGHDVVEAILDGAFATKRFYILLALAAIIAAFGLLANSAAVIIGAMIVAPLMGPILGMSIGMVRGDGDVQRKALIAEVTGVALTISLGYLVGLIPLNLGVSQEMLARTAPTSYDLAIALACGFAGGFVSVNRKVNSAIAGVSISVALVPPLATVGLLLAMQQPKESFGAFLLFLANFFCIQLASALVFAAYGLSRRSANGSKAHIIVRFLPPSVAVIAMGWFMTGTLVSLVSDHRQEQIARNVLSESIAERTGGHLSAILRREEIGSSLSITASALTPRVFEPADVQDIETRLSTALGRSVKVVLRSLVSQDVNDRGRVFLDDDERQQSVKSQEEAKYLQTATRIIEEHLAGIQGAELNHVERREGASSSELIALVSGPQPVAPAEVSSMEEELSAALKSAVHLVVRNVFSRDTDRSGYLYEPDSKRPSELSSAHKAIKERVAAVVRRRMLQKPARQVNEVNLLPSTDVYRFEVRVAATLPVRPTEVAKIEADLRRYVDARIRLVIDTTLQASASDDGWLPNAG